MATTSGRGAVNLDAATAATWAQAVAARAAAMDGVEQFGGARGGSRGPHDLGLGGLDDEAATGSGSVSPAVAQASGGGISNPVHLRMEAATKFDRDLNCVACIGGIGSCGAVLGVVASEPQVVSVIN